MPLHQDRVRIRVSMHRRGEGGSQILFEGRIRDDRDAQDVVVVQVRGEGLRG